MSHPSESLSLQEALNRVVTQFEQLTPSSVAGLGAIYAEFARFKDPFNEVQGLVAIQKIFRHMFETLDAPRFVITSQVAQRNEAFLTWEFHFRMKRWRPGVDQVVRGATHLKFDDQHLIVLHRDYWDAAEELYEKLPLMGTLLRWLKRRAGS